MYLIATHQTNHYSTFIEGFNRKYGCITLWNDADGLTQTYTPYLKHTYENRVRKEINPFN